MRLEEITASPHPGGNRIDLTWVNPEPKAYPRIRVVRRTSTYPASLDDGLVLLDGKPPAYQEAGDGRRRYALSDRDLEAETVHYYVLFPCKGIQSIDERDATAGYVSDPHNRVAAMATGPYNLAARMYALLPRIYHRYDSPPGVASELAQQLRRFLELPGGQLDQLYSMARAMLALHNVEAVDGRLLPLLAQWIGWSLDHRNEIDRQRNEIRQAPYVQATIGIIPTLEATVKRIFGWECRTKEFVHNVCLSNQPPRLNLYACESAGKGKWVLPTNPLSLDFAYEGRPAAVETSEPPTPLAGERHTTWLFYHTRRKEHWDIWCKTLEMFDLGLPVPQVHTRGFVSSKLRQAFEAQELPLSANTRVRRLPGSLPGQPQPAWQIIDDENQISGLIEPFEAGSRVRVWQASQPLTNRPSLDRHPTAAVQLPTPAKGGRRIWLFWDVYDEDLKKWRIDCRIQTPKGGWTACNAWPFDPADGAERRRPWAVADDKDGVWLVWLEREGNRWQLKYNRHNRFRWQSDGGVRVPQIREEYQQFEDLFLLYDAEDSSPKLWLFGARKVAVEKEESTEESESPCAAVNPMHWEIVYLVKQIQQGEKDNYWLEGGWIDRLYRFRPAGDGEEPTDDREPAAWLNEDGQIELFWSSNRDGSWSVWRSVLSVEPGPVPGWPGKHQWAPAEQVTRAPYMQRDPLPARCAGDRLLLFRSNQSVAYTSSVYGATETLDGRYAGCTTVDTRNLSKLVLQGRYEDFQTYTYDVGREGVRTDQDWYAWDTVGLYLTPDTDDCNLILRNQYLIEQIMREFLPIQVRPVYIIPLVSEELVYTYDFPDVEQRLIGERSVDTALPETLFTPGDSHPKDVVLGWILMRAWGVGDEDPELEHFRVTVSFPEPEEPEDTPEKPPPDTRFRTWHVGLEMEDEPWT